jgi:sulfur-oxidizing protein SoxY
MPLADRRQFLVASGTLFCAGAPFAQAKSDFEGDPLKSFQWPEMRREFLGRDAKVRFDDRVLVQGPAFAEDAMNVPITVSTKGLEGVERVMVLVDRNPIRKVLEWQPLAASSGVSFRFKLEQGSPVRAAARTSDGVWHVGSTFVESTGGGCTVSGATRADGTWTQTLGQVSGRVFAGAPGQESAARLRVRIMHPMDTGLVGGVPAFYLARLSVRDAGNKELLRIATFEPVSENPVFSFDFTQAPAGPLRIVGMDNNGNRVDSVVP